MRMYKIKDIEWTEVSKLIKIPNKPQPVILFLKSTKNVNKQIVQKANPLAAEVNLSCQNQYKLYITLAVPLCVHLSFHCLQLYKSL